MHSDHLVEQARAGSRAMPEAIPEAKAYAWHELLDSTKGALRRLIQWLDTAVETSSGTHEHEQLSTSLLLFGDRGSGKTTVLLTAAYALDDPRRFLPDGFDSGHRALLEEAELRNKLEWLGGRVSWLDTLDLEPLPAQANLLATLLVRIRGALGYPGTHSNHGRRGPSSFLDGGDEKPWIAIDRLINDATFMWEDLPGGTDPRRERAAHQITAAETFSKFPHDFQKAVQLVAEALGRGRQDEPPVLVLPIDNVDRSIEHLHSIVKLTRMAVSPRLWFLLAAGREEFQLFLERAFQRELVPSGQSEFGARSRDETLSIARRQAATTMRRALPPSYRIRLEPVRPEQAWRFPHVGAPAASEALEAVLRTEEVERVEESDFGDVEVTREVRLVLTPGAAGGVLEDSLAGLLEKLPLPKCARSDGLASFVDLFDVERRLSPEVAREYRRACEEEEGTAGPGAPLLSHAARMALTLSARTLQDLHIALQGASRKGEEPAGAVQVAVQMLSSAIDESNLPAWASQQLLNRMLRRDPRGEWVLDLSGSPIGKEKRTSLSEVLEWPRDDEGVLLSELHLRRLDDVVLELHDLDTPGRSTPVPPAVAGWFMLLHDLLMLFSPPRVLCSDVTPFEVSPQVVVTRHELAPPHDRDEKSPAREPVALDFWWTPPAWDTFIDFSLLAVQWKAFLYRAKNLFSLAGYPNESLEPPREFAESRYRFVLAAWVDNVCSVAGRRRGGWSWKETLDQVLQPGPSDEVSAAARFDRSTRFRLGDYERHVRSKVGELLTVIQEQCSGYDRLWDARKWLEENLPLLVLPEYAPHPALTGLVFWEGDVGANGAADAWQALETSWLHHARRLAQQRRTLVRVVAGRSREYEAFRRYLGPDWGVGASDCRRWIEDVCDAWFEAVDASPQERSLEALRRIARPERAP